MKDDNSGNVVLYLDINNNKIFVPQFAQYYQSQCISSTAKISFRELLGKQNKCQINKYFNKILFIYIFPDAI